MTVRTFTKSVCPKLSISFWMVGSENLGRRQSISAFFSSKSASWSIIFRVRESHNTELLFLDTSLQMNSQTQHEIVLKILTLRTVLKNA